MKNATAPAELPREYLWAFPGAPIRIHLRVAVVRGFATIFSRATIPIRHCKPRRGGLLLGRVQPITLRSRISNRSGRTGASVTSSSPL